MTTLSVSKNFLVVAKQLHIDFHHNNRHTVVKVKLQSKPQENDSIHDIIISCDETYLAVLTSTSKELLLYSLPSLELKRSFILHRSASKVRFTQDSKKVLVADKSGDALIYDIKSDNSGTKLLGHLSLLLDILHTSDGKYIITCDRDEKVKVSCFPNTYSIQTYCLGHKEFVNHLELLPHNNEILTSSSGDGTVKFWNYINGKQLYSIDANSDVSKEELKVDFIKIMDDNGIEVNSLPIIHYTTVQLTEDRSLLALTVYASNVLLLYSVHSDGDNLNHKLEQKLNLEQFPSEVKLCLSSLYLFNNSKSTITIYKIKNDMKITLELDNCRNTFEGVDIDCNKENDFECIKVLYKRKFDNVQEYQERKKQRLESKKISTS